MNVKTWNPFKTNAPPDTPGCVIVTTGVDLWKNFYSYEMLAEVFATMARHPDHRFFVFTEHLKRCAEWFEWTHDGDEVWTQLDGEIEWPLPNVAICATVRTQEDADERLPILFYDIPAAIKGVDYVACEEVEWRVEIDNGNPQDTTTVHIFREVDWLRVRRCDSTDPWLDTSTPAVRSAVEQARAAGVPLYLDDSLAQSGDEMWAFDQMNRWPTFPIDAVLHRRDALLGLMRDTAYQQGYGDGEGATFERCVEIVERARSDVKGRLGVKDEILAGFSLAADAIRREMEGER